MYGVLGYPAKHSLSPLMHNAAFAALKINAEYRIFEKKPEEVEDFIRTLSSEGISGINVTVPYKEKVIPLLDKVSDEAKLIGAVNTILVFGENLEGFNTDAEGFLRHLSDGLKFDPRGKAVSLIGAGGAAKAVSVSLAKKGAKSILIYDIDSAKSSALAESLKDKFSKTEIMAVRDIPGLDIENTDLLINATAVGMKDADPCLVPESLLHKGMLVYDLIYNPKETKLLRLARERGASPANGLGMLLYQGALAFELWTSKPAPVEIMREALNKGVDRIC